MAWHLCRLGRWSFNHRRIVYQAPEGETLTGAADTSAVLAAIDSARTDHVIATSDPFTTGTVSEDGRTALEESSNSLEANDISVAIGGDALQEVPETGTTELLGVGIAVIVLIITFGSLLVAGMPLLTAIIGVGIGVASITTLTGLGGHLRRPHRRHRPGRSVDRQHLVPHRDGPGRDCDRRRRGADRPDPAARTVRLRRTPRRLRRAPPVQGQRRARADRGRP